MELVYLWKENLRGQKDVEFNFSPKINLVSAVTRSKKIPLSVNIVITSNFKNTLNIFGPKLSVTSIVGKNGSGKTSLLDTVISEFVFSDTSSDENVKVFIVKVDEMFHVFYHKSIELDLDSFFTKKNTKKHLLDKDKNQIVNVFNDLSLIFLTNVFDGELSIDMKGEDLRTKPNYFNLSTDYYLRKMKVVDYKMIDLIDGLKFFRLKGKGSYGEPPFKLPNEVRLSFEYRTNKIEYKNLQRLNKLLIGGLPKFKKDNKKSLNFLIDWMVYSLLLDINDDSKTQEIIEKLESGYNSKLESSIDLFDRISKEYSGELNNDIIKFKSFMMNNIDSFVVSLDLINSPHFGRKKNDSTFSIPLLNKSEEISKKNLLLLDEVIIIIEAINAKISKRNKSRTNESYSVSPIKLNWSGLSSGEVALFNLYSRLNKYSINFNKYTVLLLDEPDTYLNPQWQKVFFNDFKKAIEWLFIGVDQKVHLIFTTHSPIMLSDIPKNNIIFLGDFGLNIETFGANIHSLYKNSFFLEGGLIGEFAKNKIERLIQFLLPLEDRNEELARDVDDDFSKESAQSLIDIIGEQFIRSKVQDLFNAAYGKDDEVERLRKRLEKLEGDSL